MHRLRSSVLGGNRLPETYDAKLFRVSMWIVLLYSQTLPVHGRLCLMIFDLKYTDCIVPNLYAILQGVFLFLTIRVILIFLVLEMVIDEACRSLHCLD